jgi:hypothetical protein
VLDTKAQNDLIIKCQTLNILTAEELLYLYLTSMNLCYSSSKLIRFWRPMHIFFLCSHDLDLRQQCNFIFLSPNLKVEISGPTKWFLLISLFCIAQDLC